MGGGGSFYDRDVTDKTYRTSVGTSKMSEDFTSKTKFLDPGLNPLNRRVSTQSKCPLLFGLDVTGSMGNLPKIYWDKFPMMAGEIIKRKYVRKSAELCLMAIGDYTCDKAPLQVTNYSSLRNFDAWLQRIWLEGGGGGQSEESYELAAYFALNNLDFPEDANPFLFFTGDENYRQDIPSSVIKELIGGQDPKNQATTIVFQKLLKKFKGNVFLIHREYSDREANSIILKSWEKVLTKNRIVHLPEDLAVADVTLGVLALMNRKRTLDEYLSDMREREQTNNRVKAVEKSLSVLLPLLDSQGNEISSSNINSHSTEIDLPSDTDEDEDEE